MSYLYSKLPETGVPHRIGTGGREATALDRRTVVSNPLLKQSDARVPGSATGF